MDDVANVDPRVQSAREAFERGDWSEAHRLLEELDASGFELAAEDLERFGYATVFVGPVTLEPLERAVDEYERAGKIQDAARLAVDVSRIHGGAARFAMAMGFGRRAQSLLEGQDEGPAHAHLDVLMAFLSHVDGKHREALELTERARRIAREHGEVDAESMALNRRGRVLVSLGRVDEGKADLDEAMALLGHRGMRPVAAAIVYCSTIDACAAMADYERALQWTEAASAWIGKRRISGFPGVCSVHRAELMRIRGDHEAATREAEEAIAIADRFDFGMNKAVAQGELGRQRLEAGDLDGAEAAFAAAQSAGYEPMPGLAILRLRRGDSAGALELLRSALDEKINDLLGRSSLLPAYVEAALDLGDVGAARGAAEELRSTAQTFGTVGLRARASTAAARIQIHERDGAAAIVSAKAATREWLVVGAANELIRARQLLAKAYALNGDTARAELERERAQTGAGGLGAAATIQAAQIATEAARTPDAIPPPLCADARIREGFTIDEKIDIGVPLGAGAMGIVYSGRHRVTGRDLAIKVLQRSLCGDDRQVARFLQEALACGRVKHGNVVDIYDAGEHGEEPYIVMERLEGETLSARLRREHTLAVSDATAIAQQMARGVAAAHAAEVIHRDLKPDNVFLCGEGPSPHVKVLDFGISKVPESDRTRPGALMGTPFYMAPEQVHDASQTDARTDVYGLGAVLFEMLAGRPPYVGSGAAAVLVAIVDGNPPDLAALRPELPREVVALVHRAIARNPDDRFSSATEFADALAALD